MTKIRLPFGFAGRNLRFRPGLSQRLLLAAGALSIGISAASAQSAASAVVVAPGTITAKLMPLALADPTTPTFRFGAEYRLNAHWGVEASYGVQMRNLGWGKGSQPAGNSYHKAHVEGRYYLGGSPLYLAGAALRVQQRFETGAGVLHRNGQQYGYTSATVRRAVTAGLVKAGVVVPLDERWHLDLALGLGVRHGQIDYQTREESLYQPTGYGILDCEPRCGFAIDWGPTTKPGTFWRPTAAFDVRLGYRLGR